MDKFVLYCKSYNRDLERVIKLLESIKKYNLDNIPFYLSVPKKDIEIFRSSINYDLNLIEDELVYQGNARGWIQQQIVKSSFWKLNKCENYLCIDSDSYFIKPFRVSDFMYNDTTPYTIMHEQKEFFHWAALNYNLLGFNPKESFESDRKIIMDLFNRSGKYYDFGPSPVIWSSKVWEDLEKNYIQPNNLTFEKLLEYSPSEFTWYGESILAFKSIQIMPIEPLFKVFHYKQQFNEYKNMNVSEDSISKNYFGIVVQSNF
jgi:hypothetical protein